MDALQRTHRILIVALALALSAGCRPELRSNFDVGDWAGWPVDSATATGKEAAKIVLSQERSPAMILNVYSPSCGPCIEELPALNLLYRRARELGVAMYIVATANPADHGLELDPTAPLAKRRQMIGQRLAEDVRRYGIEAPLLVMDDSFAVSASDGLITGTPETMFFRKDPLVLEYNFLGPLSAAEEPAEILKETRFQFALRILQRVRSASSVTGGPADPAGSTGYGDSDRARL